MIWLKLAGLVVLVLIAARIVVAVVRFVRLSPAARRNYPKMLRCRHGWRHLTRALGLSYTDPHKRRRILDLIVPVGQRSEVVIGRGSKVAHPRARFRVDDFGIVARVRTVPRSGRKEFDAAGQHIADSWRVSRVQVSQAKPGRLIVRGLVRDPLLVPFGMQEAPEGTWSTPDPSRIYLGRDEWGADRHVPLSGLTGVSVAGLPGFGKTSLMNSILCQLAGSPAVQLVILDGKGGGDYADWRERCWIYTADHLAAAAVAVEDVHALMRKRLLAIEGDRGLPRNGWVTGPTIDNPLIVVVIDEVQTYMDESMVKGDRTAEQFCRTVRSLTGQLVRKGRSALIITWCLTQKQTSDAIPTAIRDNCRLGLSFGVKTRDAAVAGLGEAIREYPGACPTGLREPQYIGVATATLSSGGDPFVRLRVPEVSEPAAAQRAAETAHLRRDPSVVQEAEIVPAA